MMIMSENQPEPEPLPEGHPEPQAEHVTGENPDELHPPQDQAQTEVTEPAPAQPAAPDSPGAPGATDSPTTPGVAEPLRADEPVYITPVEQETVEAPVPSPQPPVSPEQPPADAESAVPEQGAVQPGGVGAEQPVQADSQPVSPPVTMAEATSGDRPELSSVSAHPGILVRLKDVYATVENWFARHPEIAREAGADLKGALGTNERLNDIGGAAPVGDTSQQVTDEDDTTYRERHHDEPTA